MIERWEDRLAKMDTSKGVSNKMIQEAMRAEIKELRRFASQAETRLTKSKRKTIEWRGIATVYQNRLAQQVSKIGNCNSVASQR